MKSWLLFWWVGLSCLSLAGQTRYSVIIDEIMADPSPAVGLPANEWIELKNTSTVPVELAGWRISGGNNLSGPMPAFILQPDSFLIICTGSAVAAMSNFGATLAVSSFPSLANESGQVILQTADGMVMHAVAYTADWYGNDLKKEGGWTLEMIDTHAPCSGGNWKASEHAAGGTPAHKNSVDGPVDDEQPPQLSKAYAPDSSRIILVFDEPLDSSTAAMTHHYSISDDRQVIDLIAIPPFFKQVELLLNEPLLPNRFYTISVRDITDCRGNLLAAAEIRTGLAKEAQPGDWIINEILFNPRPNGFDYVEFYNAGNSLLDAAQLYIANRNSMGMTGSIQPLSATPDYVFPGEYRVVTEHAANLALNYLVKDPSAILVLPALPSLPDAEGTVITMNAQGIILDEVHYLDDWHFRLISQPEGIALERIDPLAASQDPANWSSAASTAGYGTPGYKNSQWKGRQEIQAVIDIIPGIFSPDNDGMNDIVSIHYRLDSPGTVANISIFNASGILVRQLVHNATMDRSGYWNWDGLDDKGHPLAIGIYIVVAELFNLQGKKQLIRKSLVLARRLD